MIDFKADHFALFGLPAAFRVDPAELEQRFHEVQSRVHPDRFVQADERERRLSLQGATRVNEAYRILRSPLSRAQYLLHLQAEELGSDNNTSMPRDFLLEQMEWREAVGEARAAREHHELERLHHRLRREIDQRYDELATLLDDARDYHNAADRVRRLMFFDRLLSEVDSAITACEQ